MMQHGQTQGLQASALSCAAFTHFFLPCVDYYTSWQTQFLMGRLTSAKVRTSQFQLLQHQQSARTCSFGAGQRFEIPRCCHIPFQWHPEHTTPKVPVWSISPLPNDVLQSTGEKNTGFLLSFCQFSLTRNICNKIIFFLDLDGLQAFRCLKWLQTQDLLHFM